MKVYRMNFHLYECIIHRGDHEVRGHIVAPSQDAAFMVVVEHSEALGLDHEDFTTERVDHKLQGDRRRGLDTLLRTAPVGFASFCEIGWVAHIAPVQKLKLYRTVDNKGSDVFAIAPNTDIAASIFTSAMSIPTKGEVRLLHISDGMVDLPDDQVHNLPKLMECGPIGIVRFDDAAGGWSLARRL
tara:strand:+ start:2162 stop:2716 length:555 start_codon:yes stop_codon:yes gene_type:complete